MNITICDENYNNDIIMYHIKRFCEECNNPFSINVFDTGKELVDYITNQNGSTVIPDILVVSMYMKESTGIDVVEQIKKINDSVITFFVTDSLECIPQLFRVGAFQVITLPIDPTALKIDIMRAIKKYIGEKQMLELLCNKSNAVIKLRMIQYIQVVDRRSRIYTDKGYFECKTVLKVLEQVLCNGNFVRAHQSYIVNINFISDIHNNTMTLMNGVKIELSRNKIKSVKLALKNKSISIKNKSKIIKN